MIILRYALALMIFVGHSCALALPAGALEQSVCGAFREWLAFRTWSKAAGAPDDAAFLRMTNVSRISHITADRRTLRGFRINAASPARGALLFAQGNGMLADQVLDILRPLAEAGFDIYVYDFRGYGRSEGKPRLKAIVSDYLELAHAIGKAQPGRLYFYGVSFGGIVLSNVFRSAPPVRALVIDSSPSTVSDLGCPAYYDPVANIPAAAGTVMLLVAERDDVIPPQRSQELARKILANGGTVERRRELEHPFSDSDRARQALRMRIVTDFLKSK
jgi:pimeloyl-ACP methyl ester carboxylesterase